MKEIFKVCLCLRNARDKYGILFICGYDMFSPLSLLSTPVPTTHTPSPTGTCSTVSNYALKLDPAIPLLGIYLKKTKTLIFKEPCTPMFIAALFIIAKIWKQPKYPSINEWIKKVWYLYTMEHYSAIKKNEILPFAVTWMGLEGIMLSEISQTENDKYSTISLICEI